MEVLNRDQSTKLVRRTGIVYPGDPRKVGAKMPAPDGRHLWVVQAIYRVDDPARERQSFDGENLMSIDGPGCWHCGASWSPTVGARCPGRPLHGGDGLQEQLDQLGAQIGQSRRRAADVLRRAGAE